MIPFTFNRDDMIIALEQEGYWVEKEEIKPDWYDTRDMPPDNDYTETVWMVYNSEGDCVTAGPLWERLYGQERLEEFFTMRLKLKLLGLFS